MKGVADAEVGNVRGRPLPCRGREASRAAVGELTKAYQELAAKNVTNLTAAMQALAAAKSQTEFIELQKQLIKDGVEAAVKDSQHIAQLTTAVFTAAFEPMKKQIEAVQKSTRIRASVVFRPRRQSLRSTYLRLCTLLAQTLMEHCSRMNNVRSLERGHAVAVGIVSVRIGQLGSRLSCNC